MNTPQRLLQVAAGFSFAIALFQAVVTFSVPWSEYFGAPSLFLANPPLLYVTGMAAALFFFGFGLYALSGAGTIRRLPMLRGALLLIGALYTLRGLFLVMEILMNTGYLRGAMIIPARELSASTLALIVGVMYLAGTIGLWSQLRPNLKAATA